MTKIPRTPPPLDELLEHTGLASKLARLLETSPLPDGDYYHWDQLRHRSPPADLTHEEWWTGVKLSRTQQLKPISLEDKEGRPFQYWSPDPVLRLLHEVDKEASGRIQIAEEVTNPSTRDRYIINSLIEESITSSQLEGAATTTDVAKDMIRSGRRPSDKSERMILNNYHAMRFVRENVGNPLTPAMLFTLHSIVTDRTLDDPSKAGTIRAPDDQIVIEDGYGNLLHVPPPPSELDERIDLMCRFANERPDDTFVHPVIRAIILHFWVGYDHPFVDGNGRAARALFYWSMLSQGYWLTEYISISRILKKAPGQYSRPFLYTETDANDLTYFLLYQLRVIRRAIDELQAYLARKIAEVREVDALLRQSSDLNYRQLALLSHALKHPGHRYTIQSHQTSHGVAYQTARTDLLDLVDRGLLIQRKRGRTYVFSAPAKLGEILQEPEPLAGSS
ncbi:MAG: Fic family protein [Gemmatimonadota bacterium]